MKKIYLLGIFILFLLNACHKEAKKMKGTYTGTLHVFQETPVPIYDEWGNAIDFTFDTIAYEIEDAITVSRLKKDTISFGFSPTVEEFMGSNRIVVFGTNELGIYVNDEGFESSGLEDYYRILFEYDEKRLTFTHRQNWTYFEPGKIVRLDFVGE